MSIAGILVMSAGMGAAASAAMSLAFGNRNMRDVNGWICIGGLVVTGIGIAIYYS